DFMFELMNIADIIVSKGGPATVLEALMLEKPLIVSQYVFGQEKGNVDFVRRERVGIYSSDPKEIVRHIERLVENPSVYEKYRERIQALQLRNGTSEIADFIVDYERPKKMPQRQPFTDFIREMLDSTSRQRYSIKQVVEHLTQLATESTSRRRKM
ncbi:MAG TPA: glycosyltransferase, partial [Spirochaetia bacterium]|nr:glycosyltransferase [Spirochaetia bacterium]